MKWKVILLLTVLVSQTCGISLAGSFFENASVRAARSEARNSNHDIHFYGQVVDFDGAPVSGALVKMGSRVSMASASEEEFPRYETVTDAHGRFHIKSYGELIELDGIVKDGYQYRYSYNNDRSFWSKKPSERHGPGYSPDNPALFRIRKKAPPAFMLGGGMNFSSVQRDPPMLDLIKRTFVYDKAVLIAMQYSAGERDWHTDIVFKTEGEPGAYQVVLEAPDAESGFVTASPEFFEEMTEAPEQGYQPRLTVPVQPGNSPLFLYFKGQGGLFYSRLQVSFDEQKKGVAFEVLYSTNMTRGRGLELSSEMARQYDRDVRTSQGRKLLRRADLLSGRPIEVPVVSEEVKALIRKTEEGR